MIIAMLELLAFLAAPVFVLTQFLLALVGGTPLFPAFRWYAQRRRDIPSAVLPELTRLNRQRISRQDCAWVEKWRGDEGRDVPKS